MSPRLPAVTAQQVARVAGKLGFRLDRQRGSHAVYYRDSDRARIVIPMHPGRAMKPKTLAGMLQDMGITAEDLRTLL